MKQKTDLLLSQKGTPLCVIICLLCLSLFRCTTASAQPIGNTFAWYATGTRAFDNVSETIYDNTNGAIDPALNCRRSFLFADYIDDSIHITWGYNAQFTGFENWAIVIVDNGVRIDSFPKVLNASASATVAFAFTTKGYKSIEFWHETPHGSNNYVQAFIADLTIIPKIDKVWVEVPEFCSNTYPANTDYHFKIKTSPYSIKDLMFEQPVPSYNYLPPAAISCATGQKLKVLIESNASIVNQLPIPVHGVSQLTGSGWSNTTGPGIDVEDHYILYSDPSNPDLSDLLPGGQYYGYAPYLNVHFSDGIQDLNFAAPMIIKSDTNSADTTNNIPASSYHLYNYTVSGDEVWTPQSNPAQAFYGTRKDTLRIQHRLTIPPNKKLSIHNMVVEFGPMARIICKTNPGGGEYGGMLVIDSTVLTCLNACGVTDSMWEGITLEGDNAKTQQYYTSTWPYRYYQGTLIMNHSELSFAHEGIVNADVSNVSTKSGGIVFADNSKFYNNGRSACFNYYVSTSVFLPYLGRFNTCDFKVDRALKYPFRGFISGWAVKGVLIKGCKFNDTSGVTTSSCYGVYGSDFGVAIGDYPAGNIHTEFHNLHRGVYDNVVYGTSSMSVKNCLFYKVDTGIQSNGGVVTAIQNNSFKLGSAGLFAPDKIGILAEGTTGFTIWDNNFDGTYNGGSYPGINVGVLIWNCGASTNKVARNIFTKVGTATLSNYSNRGQISSQPTGLQFLCNDYGGTMWDIAVRGAGGGNDGIAANQGNATHPAGNEFKGNASYQPGQNIYNPSTEVNSLTYYYGTGTYENPGNTTGTTTTATNLSKNCADSITGGGSVNPNNNNQRLINHYLTEPKNDSLLIRDSLHYWVNQWHEPDGDLLEALLLLEDGYSVSAASVFNGIVDKYELEGEIADEYNLYGKAIFDILVRQQKNGLLITNLRKEDVSKLESIAGNAKTWAKVRAQNWLTLYDGRVFENDLLFPDMSLPDGARKANVQTETTSLNLFPNPVHDYLRINWQGQKENGTVLQVMDITGRTVLSSSLTGSSGAAYIDVRMMTPGIYLYRIMNGKQTIDKGKLVKDDN